MLGAPLTLSVRRYREHGWLTKGTPEDILVTDTFTRNQVFQRYFDSKELSGPIRSIVELLVSDAFSSVSFDRLVENEVLPRNLNIQENLLDLALVFARTCVDDHRLSVAEIRELESFVAIFRINESDFRRFRGDDVKAIVYAQAVWILEDEYVTEEEEIRQSDLQRLFGFSYDQYVSLLRPLAKQHIKRLEGRRMANDNREELKLIEAATQNLRSVFLVRQ